MTPWIEAMRLRTLPVSCSGVIAACALARISHCFKPIIALICLTFAILAQIASNFANEYYDYRDGLDRPGREGPRRGVTEGDITPRAMKNATLTTVALACLLGLSLLYFGPRWLILIGIAVVIGLYAYSAGPYPLSRHSLGELAVIIFFGIIPVNITYYLMAGDFDTNAMLISLTIGLMGANILIVNNYRDIADDRAVGKNTLATHFGPIFATTLYLINGYLAIILSLPLIITTLHPTTSPTPTPATITLTILPAAIYLLLHTTLWIAIRRRSGRALNPMLGLTALNMLLFSLLLLLI